MARPASIADTELIDALSRVMSRYGYEGASLNRLAEAAGLKRASLYHRFPGGKAEILESALARADERFTTMLAPAHEPGEPAQRAREIASRINAYYEGGQESCLIVALSIADDERRAMSAPCLEAWMAAFERISVDAGVPPEAARLRAQQLVAEIEGALVIASATDNRAAFGRVIDELPTRLIQRN